MDLTEALAIVRADPRYRVLEEFRPSNGRGIVEYHDNPDANEIHIGLYLDTETTSLSTETAEVIELAAVRFGFDATGTIYWMADAVSGLEEPSGPIPTAITALTGITDEMVKGRRISDIEVAQAMDGVVLVVAHNAGYDRKVAERRWPGLFESLPFGCSYKNVDWKAFGSACSKLSHVLMSACGMFPSTSHRALDDCRAGIHALHTATDANGRSAFSYLLESVKRPAKRIYAAETPYDLRHLLKQREGGRYSWSDGDDGRPRAWYRDVSMDEIGAELEWLRVTMYGGREDFRQHITLVRNSARDQFSVREK